MNRIGAQEFLLPALHPAELWKESGRWEIMGENQFRLRDRKSADMVLGMTHEEVFTSIARNAVNSYRQLPQVWYQIQTKFRDEARPKSGLLRVREFTMKDAYSFDIDRDGLDKAFEAQHDAYVRIFTRCGLRFNTVEASSGAMGGSQSTEFMVRTDAGEDDIAVCAGCDYSANVEKAKSLIAPVIDQERALDGPEEFPTPGIVTIEQLLNFPGGAPADRQIKTLVYVLDDRLTLVLMRGDHELNQTKLADATGALDIRPAQADEIREALGALPGSLGAVGVTKSTHPRVSAIFADESLRGRCNMTTGANRDGYHFRGVSIEDHIKADSWADLRKVKAGEPCPNCAGGQLQVFKAVEIGHIFKLGTRYSERLGARVLTADGAEVPIMMGSYGIGVERVLVSAVELYNDDAGIIWPVSIAPFHAVVTPVNAKEPDQLNAARKLYEELTLLGVETLLDDRDERAGVKFKDAELIGVPFRLTVGKKIKDGSVELMSRATGLTEDIAFDAATSAIKSKLAAAE
jgi:prolyl-tRNA synthetase